MIDYSASNFFFGSEKEVYSVREGEGRLFRSIGTGIGRSPTQVVQHLVPQDFSRHNPTKVI